MHHTQAPPFCFDLHFPLALAVIAIMNWYSYIDFTGYDAL